MTEQLKQAAQQALACMRGLQQHLGPNICAIEADALERALTTSQPAQAGEQWMETAAALNYYAHNGNWPTQPAAQATPEPVHYIGARITDGKLYASVMRRDSDGIVTVVATAEMHVGSLHGRDCIAQMTPAAPPQQAAGEPVGEREQLRAAQAAAVMPLIGPLLDAWESADREVMNEAPELSKQLKAINIAMENADTHPAPGVPEDVLAVLQAIHRRPSDAGIWLDDLTHIIRAVAAQARGG